MTPPLVEPSAAPSGSTTEAAASSRPVGRVVAGFAGLVVLGVAVVALGQWRAMRTPRVVTGLRIAGQDIGGAWLQEGPAGAPRLETVVDHLIDGLLDERVTLGGLEEDAGADGKVPHRTATRRQLGMRVDRDALVAEAGRIGRGGSLRDVLDRLRARRGRVDLRPSLRVDRAAALEFLVDLKDDVDRAAVDAHLDLDHHGVTRERPGCLLKVYDALVAVEYLAKAGVGPDAPRTLALGTSAVPARVTAARLAEIDISTVLGAWETRYSSVGPDSDRTYNLKVGADHLNGHILLPGQPFSFNEVVGDRTEKEGYRVAPVIQSGELVDGLAGGMCQIASTLHAAAFFAGLEIVSSTPHSRPSSYITMGLDSTVVYPTTDLKLRNPYDFPIVMHYTVNQGSVKVELLGKARPNRVVFEREIRAENGFATETRRDPNAPLGQRLTLQEGYPGYSLVRRRYVFAADQVPRVPVGQTVEQALARSPHKPVSKKEWTLRYPSTALIVAIGSGPKSLKKKDPPPAHRIPPLRPEERGVFRITR